MDKNIKVFIVHIKQLSLMLIHLAQKAQIILLIVEKIKIPTKDLDFADVFSKQKVIELLKIIQLNQ